MKWHTTFPDFKNFSWIVKIKIGKSGNFFSYTGNFLPNFRQIFTENGELSDRDASMGVLARKHTTVCLGTSILRGRFIITRLSTATAGKFKGISKRSSARRSRDLRCQKSAFRDRLRHPKAFPTVDNPKIRLSTAGPPSAELLTNRQ